MLLSFKLWQNNPVREAPKNVGLEETYFLPNIATNQLKNYDFANRQHSLTVSAYLSELRDVFLCFLLRD